MPVQTIIKGAVAVQKTIAGIQAAFEDAPTSLSQLPCFVTMPGAGQREWPRKPSIRTVTHDMDMFLYVQKGGDLQAADRLLKPFVDTVIETFDQNLQLNGSCFDSGVVSYNYGILQYAGVDYLGIKFTLRAVEMATVVYKP